LNFNFKVHQKSFVGSAPPGPAGGAYLEREKGVGKEGKRKGKGKWRIRDRGEKGERLRKEEEREKTVRRAILIVLCFRHH